MNSNSEDFPVPVSPTRRMLYGALALFFDVLMTPFLRDFISLENTIRPEPMNVAQTYLMVGTPSLSVVAMSRSS